MAIRWMAAVVLAMVSTGASAMDVWTFLARTDALEARGILALGSPDIDLLQAELGGVMRDYQADKAAARKAGKPSVCAPEGAKMSRDDLLKALATVPAAQQGMSVEAGFYRIVRQRWPCPKR